MGLHFIRKICKLLTYILILIFFLVKTMALSPNENEDNDETIVANDVDSILDEDSLVFNPTEEWKTITEGQKVPAGLHYRINLQTGLKEAKILEPDIEDDSKDRKSLTQVATEKNPEEMVKLGERKLVTEEMIEALKNIKSEDKKSDRESIEDAKARKKSFRSYAEIKDALDELSLNTQTDGEIITQLIGEYKSSSLDEIKIGILEDLDYLCHQFDNAVNFVFLGGINAVVLPGLNSSITDIRKSVLKLLGSASQSNPKVQIAAVESGLLNVLIRIIARETNPSVSSNAVFALSCIVRGFPHGQHGLVQNGGLPTLREVFLRQDWQSLPVQLKVVSLIQDLITERSNAEGERMKQLEQIDLESHLVESDFCSAVSSLLTVASFDKRGKRQDLGSALGRLPLRPDHDTVDKVTSAMVALMPSCGSNFNDNFVLLKSLEETYLDLAYKEQYQVEGHEFFRDIAKQIGYLIENIKNRDEL